MKIDRKQMKADAKAAMKQQKPKAWLVTLVFLAIVFVLSMLSVKLENPGMSFSEIGEAMLQPEQPTAMAAGRVSFIGSLLDVAVSFMTVLISVGYTSFCLNVSRCVPAGFGDLFDAFAFFLKALWLNILIGLFVTLWSLLLIIPGIVAAYRYRLAVFILLDDPDKRAIDCIRESKELTMGYKGQLFVLDLSFIGWSLLCIIPFVIFFVYPYMEVTSANFYKAISGRQDSGDALPAPTDSGRDPWENW